MVPVGQLKEWISIHLKNRDLLQKAIIGFEEVPGYDLAVKRADGDQFYLVRPDLADAGEIVAKGLDRRLGVVTLNKKRNVEFLIENWDAFKVMDRLCFFFVNPAAGEKWMLFPKTHELITEKPALRPGLMSLYAGVAPCD